MKWRVLSSFYFLVILIISKDVLSQPTLWSKAWTNYDSGRIKDALVLDEEGSLLVLGQAFTKTDSIDHPSLFARINAEGEMIASKPVGRYGRWKGEMAKTDKIGFYHEHRLSELHQLPDGRMIAIGYKKTMRNEEKLWLVHISKDLEIIWDSVYNDFNISIGCLKSFDSGDGFRLVYRTYNEENNLSRYNFELLTFDKDLNCTERIRDVVVPLNQQPSHMYWIYDVVEKGGLFYFTCSLGITGPTIDEDETERKSCLVAFDPRTSEAKVLQMFDNDYMMECLAFGENGEYVLGLERKLSNNDKKINTSILIIGFDAKHREIWRDERILGQYQNIDLIVFRKNRYECMGMCSSDRACVFYSLNYTRDGQPVFIHFSEDEGYDKEVVREVKGVKGKSFRLYVDNGWRIEAFQDTQE